MKKILIPFLLLPLLLWSCSSSRPGDQPAGINWNDEIIYHVMQRSFYDSSGNRHGDLQGFIEKLDYLEELGVTALLFTPLYASDFYHNYFPTDYEKIDPAYGSMEDYLAFVGAVHKKGMKFIMDMETQYVQSGHRWFEDSYKNPDSPYNGFINYSDAENRFPEQFLRPSGSDIYKYRAWPDQWLSIFHLDLNQQEVKDWMKDFYTFWVDPRGDGSFEGGVDGFRIDHIMDDLDYKGIFTNLYTDFWRPLFGQLKAVRPGLFIVGEQSNWLEYGDVMMGESGADGSFGFMARYAIAGVLAELTPEYALDKGAAYIGEIISETLRHIPEDKYYIHFLENHDINRWASEVGQHEGKLRLGAVLTLTLPGIPSIYYGQELGVTGQVADWSYDVNHIPVREAFPWAPNPDEPGIAVFYRDTGPWWDQSYFNTGEAGKFALSEQKDDPASLWNLYRKLISLRKQHEALRQGNFSMTGNTPDRLLAFTRSTPEEQISVYINLSDDDLRLDQYVDKKVIMSEKTSFVQNKPVIRPYGFLIATHF